MSVNNRSFFALLLVSALIISVSLCGCTTENDDAAELEICRGLSIDSLPSFTVEDKTFSFFDDGSREDYMVISFSDQDSAELEKITSSWKNTPVISTYSNFYDYVHIIPQSSLEAAKKKLTQFDDDRSVKYIFFDKTDEFKRKYETQIKEFLSVSGKKESSSMPSSGGYYFEEDDPRTPDYAVGFCCAFYSPTEKKLYYYHYEPVYSEENVIRAANSD